MNPITAKEACELYLKNVHLDHSSRKDDLDFARIMKGIKEISEWGMSVMYTVQCSQRVLDKLAALGYTLEMSGETTNISWWAPEEINGLSK